MTEWFSRLKSVVNREMHEPADAQTLARAAAVILLEMSAADDHRDPGELEVIHQAMQRAFDLGEAELEGLLAEAGGLQKKAVSLHDFTRDLRTGLEPEQRAELIGWLWRVAYADGRLDRYEEHLVRRLADLLGVPHEEFIRRKHLAREQMD